MKRSGLVGILVLFVLSGSAFAGDPMLEDIMSNGILISFTVLFNLAIISFLLIAQWKPFAKAGEEGWIVLIPL